MQPAGQDSRGRAAPGMVAVPLCSRTNASPFWIMLLHDLFGEHTFLLDSHGLNIVEPVEAEESGMIVNLASWSDDSRSGLELHEPEATDVVITLGLRH